MLKTTKQILILTLCVVATAFLFLPALSWAQEEQLLDEILSGFEDEKMTEDDGDEVDEGLKDETQKDRNTDGLTEDEILEELEEESKAPQPEASKKQVLPSFLDLDGYFKIVRCMLFTATKLPAPIPAGTV